jgi:hypothetical protein
MNFNIDHFSIGLILIGIACIMLLDNFSMFPGILLVIGVSQIPKLFFKANKLRHFQSILWLCGIPLLMMFKLFWPGLLILTGLSIVLDAFRPLVGDKTQHTSKKTEYITYD